ncbi:MAG TPA: sigma-70 family RNA polymerase sigma factor [Gaiellaceae bacterium]|nr:sigma-70 family RNA polymerase sigma factor [Gaiellaceae bacterium]
MLRDVHEAEDAAQQAFLSAYKALLGGAQVRDSGGWLATIARNECRGRIAAGMRRPLPIADEDLDAIPSPADEQARRAQLLELRDALAELPERQREAIVLRYLYGLRYREVATALGISRPATEALLFRARRALQIRLRPVAGVALVVPLAVREELALAIPGFATGAGTSAAAFGAAGGVLAKLTAGPVGVKAATAAVAVSTVGAVGTVGSDRPAPSDSGRVPIVESSPAESTDEDGSRSGSHVGARRPGEADDDDRSREPAGRDDRQSSGPSSGGDADERDRRGGDDSAVNPEPDDSSGPGSGDESDDD